MFLNFFLVSSVPRATLISLINGCAKVAKSLNVEAGINVEVGIKVEGVQKLPNH